MFGLVFLNSDNNNLLLLSKEASSSPGGIGTDLSKETVCKGRINLISLLGDVVEVVCSLEVVEAL